MAPDPEASPPARSFFARWPLSFVIVAIGGAAFLLFEFAPALLLGLEGDDFELFALARIGGMSPAALFIPHRGIFLKPVVNLIWALLVPLFGAHPMPWHALALALHLGNALLLGGLASALCAAWDGRSLDGAGATGSTAPHTPDAPRIGRVQLGGNRTDLAFGALTALVWAAHDRLAEPVFSVASLNHSVTFAFSLAALAIWLRAARTRSGTDRALAALVTLAALFSYEIGASVLIVAGAMILIDPRGPVRERVRYLAPALGACALVYAAIQALIRLAPQGVSYYAPSGSVALNNLCGLAIAYAHVPPGILTSAGATLLGLGTWFVALGIAALHARDPIVRLGLIWAIASLLPIAPIPVFSDRYHYAPFAALTLALARVAFLHVRRARSGERMATEASTNSSPARGRIVAAAVVAIVATHLGVSFLAAREDAAFHAMSGLMARGLLGESEQMLASIPLQRGDMLAVVWAGPPDLRAQLIARYDADPAATALPIDLSEIRLWPLRGAGHLALRLPRLGPRDHPVFVRPDAIVGVVEPADLYQMAGARTGIFVRRPEPLATAQAIADRRVRIAPAAFFHWGQAWNAEAPAALMRAIEASLRDGGSVPVAIASPLAGVSGPMRVAYLEVVDRAGAYDEEFGRTPK